MTLNVFFGAKLLNQPVDADSRGIGGVEPSDVSQGTVTSFRVDMLVAGQEIQKRFVGPLIVHLCEQVVHLREEIARLQLRLTRAPGLALNFVSADFVLAEDVPDFWRTTVDELGAKLNRIAGDIVACEDPAADAIASLENG